MPLKINKHSSNQCKTLGLIYVDKRQTFHQKDLARLGTFLYNLTFAHSSIMDVVDLILDSNGIQALILT